MGEGGPDSRGGFVVVVNVVWERVGSCGWIWSSQTPLFGVKFVVFVSISAILAMSRKQNAINVKEATGSHLFL